MNYSKLTHPDPLTVAYISLGYCYAMERLPDDQKDQMLNEGQSNFVESVIAHAGFIDFVFLGNIIDFDDVDFYYDVAEPFGQQYVEAVAKQENYFDHKELAISVLRSILKEALSPGSFNRIFTDTVTESESKKSAAINEAMLVSNQKPPKESITPKVLAR